MILVGNKRKIIITQEEISGREIVEVKFIGETKRTNNLEAETRRMSSRK